MRVRRVCEQSDAHCRQPWQVRPPCGTNGWLTVTNSRAPALSSIPLSSEITGTSAVAEFVRQSGGTKVIEKVLIANNGIAAVKGIRSIRKWAYETFGNERAIEFTVMATPEDMKANADYIRMADSFVEVPGGTNNNNYANVELIVELAERLGVHGVWAGWGHASENPKLPDMLSRTASKIAFLGPPGSAMRALGDKISSTIVAQSAQVPCIPWSGDGLTIDCSNVKVRTRALSGWRTGDHSLYWLAHAHRRAAPSQFPMMSTSRHASLSPIPASPSRSASASL